MSAGYTADERRTAVRCVDCPSCGAKQGEECHHVGYPVSLSSVVPAHKRRVDKFYNDTFGPDSPAVKELLESTERLKGSETTAKSQELGASL